MKLHHLLALTAALLPGLALAESAAGNGEPRADVRARGEAPALGAPAASTAIGTDAGAVKRAPESPRVVADTAPRASTEPATSEPPAADTTSSSTPSISEASAATGAATPPASTAFAWNATAGTLTASAADAAITEVIDGLAGTGIEVKLHPSWESVRITDRFEDLPLRDAVTRLFGKTFVLTWSSAPVESRDSGAPRATHDPMAPEPVAERQPRIILLPHPSASATETATAPTGGEADVRALETLAESSSPEVLRGALEVALVDSNERLRTTALALLALDRRRGVDPSLLYGIARSDTSAEARRKAVGLIPSHVGYLTLGALSESGPADQPVLASTRAGGDEAIDALNQARTDPDPEVREAATEAIDLIAERARILASLDQTAKNWLFKEHVNGPLAEQMSR